MPMGRYDDPDLPVTIPGPVPFQKHRSVHPIDPALATPANALFDKMPSSPFTAPGVIDPTRSATANLPRVPFEDTLMRGILSAPGPPPAMAPEEEEMPLGF